MNWSRDDKLLNKSPWDNPVVNQLPHEAPLSFYFVLRLPVKLPLYRELFWALLNKVP